MQGACLPGQLCGRQTKPAGVDGRCGTLIRSPSMGRLGRGWALTRESWAVVRNDRSLLVFPVVAGVCALLAAGAIVAVGALAAGDTAWILIVFAVIALYVVIAIGQFCAVALAACATKSLDGADT